MRIVQGQVNFFGNQLFQQTANIVAVIVPNVPGLEYTLPSNKMHYALDDGKMHYSLPSNLFHYTLPDEDA